MVMRHVVFSAKRLTRIGVTSLTARQKMALPVADKARLGGFSVEPDAGRRTAGPIVRVRLIRPDAGDKVRPFFAVQHSPGPHASLSGRLPQRQGQTR
jgi:hypothetical protein